MKRRFLFIASVIYFVLFTAIIFENCKKEPANTTKPCTTPNPPKISSNSPIDSNTTLHLYASYVSGATYKWTGPNNFSDTSRNPVINNAKLSAVGNYSVSINVNGCVSSIVSTYVVVKGTYTDPRDGYTYKTVIIGNLEWFAENMQFDPTTLGGNQKLYDNAGSWLQYLGRLYDWNTACIDDLAGVKGDGWRLPDTNDWGALIKALGGIYETGANLKATNAECPQACVWAGTNAFATNSSGFTAFPAGFFSANQFSGIGTETTFWSSKEYTATQAFGYNLNYQDSWIHYQSPNKVDFYYVRLVRNVK